MGVATRQARTQRFIDTFAEQIVRNSGFKPGTQLTVKGVSLGINSSEEVRLFVKLQDEAGQILTVTEENIYFTPDCDERQDLEDWIAENIITPEGKPLTETAIQALADKVFPPM